MKRALILDRGEHVSFGAKPTNGSPCPLQFDHQVSNQDPVRDRRSPRVPAPPSRLAGMPTTVLTCAACAILVACSAVAPESSHKNGNQESANSSKHDKTTENSGGTDTNNDEKGAAGDANGNGGSITIPGPKTGEIRPVEHPDESEQVDAGNDGTCGSVEVDARVETTETVVEIPGNVLFVVDQSSSMAEQWETEAKWAAANDALIAAFTSLQEKLRAGAILFPTASATTTRGRVGATGLCPDVAPITSSPQMPIQDGVGFMNAWKAHWKDGEAALQVGTPTEAGLTRAEEALSTPPEGNTAVVLMTDGQPSCGANEAAIVARLLTKNIKTYVVGLPGARDGVTVLDAIAKAGGTAPTGCVSDCFLSPANAADLEIALANIASTTVTKTTVRAIEDCKFTLTPPENTNVADVHLIATDSTDGKQYEVPRSSTDGWTLSADNKTAVLEGAICEGAREGSFASFSFQYGCVSVPPLTPK